MSRISVVTPTLRRPDEVPALLENLARQTVLPFQVILVDGAPAEETETEQRVRVMLERLPFECVYVRHGGGTAIQRNVGIDRARGEFIAFIDDDVRLEPDYFEQVLAAYEMDREGAVGGIAGYIVNQYLDPATSPRWRWYRRLKLFTTYEPGRYDYLTGYPINRYLQPPHEGIREIDFMGSNCGVWRREVLDSGLRFGEFFSGYGVLEDAHFALRARRHWKLWECGLARCFHYHSSAGRTEPRMVAWKTAVNYRYVFMDIVPHRTWKHELRFWRVQWFELMRILIRAVRTRDRVDWSVARGKLEGIIAAMRLRTPAVVAHSAPR